MKKFNYSDVKSASTPVDLEKPLVKDGDADDVDVHLYRSMIGSLMYLTASRPDIMFAVCACARFQVTPKTSHLLAIKRIFRYLKGKPTLGLWYSRDSPFELVAYTDSDYAGSTLDRKSTTEGFNDVRHMLMLPVQVPAAKGDFINTSIQESDGFAEIIDFLNASSVHYALTVNPIIYPSCIQQFWATTQVKTVNGVRQLQALIDKKKLIITEASIRSDLHLEDAEAKDAQAKEIVALKKRIQRLERRKMSRPTGLKRLRKVIMSRRVESSKDQESLGAPEDASKQGRSIEDIDADVDVSLVDETQERRDDDLMFDTGVLEDDEMHVEAKVDRKDEQSTNPNDSTGWVKHFVLLLLVDTDSVVLQLLRKEPSEFRVPQVTQPSSSKDKRKGIMIEPEVPLKKKDQIALDKQIARDIQAKLDAELLEEQKLAREQEEEANIALIESWENIQAMIEADRLLAERLQSKEREELTDEEKAKLFMELMEKRRKHFAALRA
ncbi:hypothetical protein Tco_0639698 [Tanacetum coccineum]